MFSFTILEKNGHIFVELQGRLMIHVDAQKLHQDITKQINEEKNHVIISFDKLDYLNSSGLGALITILTKSRNMGGDTIITKVPQIITKLLLVSKLNTVFKIVEDTEEAINSIEKIKNN